MPAQKLDEVTSDRNKKPLCLYLLQLALNSPLWHRGSRCQGTTMNPQAKGSHLLPGFEILPRFYRLKLQRMPEPSATWRTPLTTLWPHRPAWRPSVLNSFRFGSAAFHTRLHCQFKTLSFQKSLAGGAHLLGLRRFKVSPNVNQENRKTGHSTIHKHRNIPTTEQSGLEGTIKTIIP